jgi:hypothetical protein
VEQAVLVGDRPREGALAMAEKFRFQQVFGSAEQLIGMKGPWTRPEL